MKRGSLRGRVECLESAAGNASPSGGRDMTGEEFADWVATTRSEYLELGYLMETPAGLALGDNISSHLEHEHSLACLLTALPDILRYRGFQYPEELSAFWGGPA